jgi:alanine dehydrogenase
VATSTFEQSQQTDRSTLMLGAAELSDCIDMPRVIDAIGEAFAAYQGGEAQMPPKTYIDLRQYNGDFRAKPAYVNDAAGVK